MSLENQLTAISLAKITQDFESVEFDFEHFGSILTEFQKTAPAKSKL